MEKNLVENRRETLAFFKYRSQHVPEHGVKLINAFSGCFTYRGNINLTLLLFSGSVYASHTQHIPVSSSNKQHSSAVSVLAALVR